jgi:hypothetical protein
MTGQESWTGLSEAITAVRAELEQANLDGQGHTLRFRTGPVELEFAVNVQKDAKAGAKVSVLPWGASVHAEAGYATGSTSRLKITLQPVDAEGNDHLIRDQGGERD